MITTVNQKRLRPKCKLSLVKHMGCVYTDAGSEPEQQGKLRPVASYWVSLTADTAVRQLRFTKNACSPETECCKLCTGTQSFSIGNKGGSVLLQLIEIFDY